VSERLVRGAFLLAKTSAAPKPFRWYSGQARLDGIVLYVTHNPAVMVFIANIAVEVIMLPERAPATQNLVGYFGGVTFPAFQDFS